MSRITLLGILSVVLGLIAYFVDCPYGVQIMIVGAVLAIVGMFMRTTRRTTGV